MPKRILTVEETLPLLATTPQRIVALTDGLAPSLLRTAPEQDAWSANEVLAHLRSCADVWGDCIATILAGNHPTIRAIDPRTWMKQTDYPLLEFQPSLQVFISQRAELLAVLESLKPDDWSRSATMTGSGAPIERTVLSFAQRLARHERSHVKQLERILTAIGE
jgi:hypothetical protein